MYSSQKFLLLDLDGRQIPYKKKVECLFYFPAGGIEALHDLAPSKQLRPWEDIIHQEPKKHPNQFWGGNFVDRKVWGNFGNGGSKKVWVFRVCSLIFSLWGACLPTPNSNKNETANPEHPNFFWPPIAKISPNFSVYKIFPKSLVRVFFFGSWMPHPSMTGLNGSMAG